MTSHHDLRKAAERATQGEWEYIPVAPGRSVDFIRTEHGPTVADFGAYPPSASDATFIALASPRTVLGLLDEIDMLRSACQKWQDHFTDTPGLAAANAEIVSLRHHLSESRAECVVIAAKLASVTAALGEACDVAEQSVYGEHGPSARLKRIAELRKAGMP